MSHCRLVGRSSAPPTAVLLSLLGTSLLLSLTAPAARSQLLPVTRLAYSAKYICGVDNPSNPIPAGDLTTTVFELHNPHTTAVVCSVKVVQDYPSAQLVVPQYAVTVAANGTLYFDCASFGGAAPKRMGFLEIVALRQVKVVAVYRETAEGTNRSIAIGKKSCPFVIGGGVVRHSATVRYGESLTSWGESTHNDATVSIANLAHVPVSANISISSAAGVVTSFPRLLPPNGFTTVTAADLPPSTPLPFVGGVTVEYPDLGLGGVMEVEEILEKYVGGRSPSVSLSVVEVQPIPLR